ncbi:hypothetical protein M3Y97_00656100 [Aphelenchoides bicaudatus]|nr:hypothetical protein M3Y97_00656100 [Aphelenchoides bicaudatus]
MNIDAQEKMDIATLKMEWGCLLNTIIADATSRKLEKQSGNQTVKNTCEIYDGEKELRVFNYTTKLMLNYASREPRPCFTYGSYSGLCKGVSAIVKKSLVNQTTTCGCPVFNVKINPTLYQVKEGDHFDEKLLTRDFDCADSMKRPLMMRVRGSVL